MEAMHKTVTIFGTKKITIASDHVIVLSHDVTRKYSIKAFDVKRPLANNEDDSSLQIRKIDEIWEFPN